MTIDQVASKLYAADLGVPQLARFDVMTAALEDTLTLTGGVVPRDILILTTGELPPPAVGGEATDPGPQPLPSGPAFPVALLLDDFNRADENPVAGDWATSLTSFFGAGNGLRIFNSSGQIGLRTDAVLQSGESLYTARTFDRPCEAHITKTITPFFVWLSFYQNLTSSPQGYAALYNSIGWSGQPAAVQLWRLDNVGDDFVLLGVWGCPVAEAFGLRIGDNDVQAYVKVAGIWQLVGYVQDRMHLGPFYVGVGMLDNFGSVTHYDDLYAGLVVLP